MRVRFYCEHCLKVYMGVDRENDKCKLCSSEGTLVVIWCEHCMEFNEANNDETCKGCGQG